MQIHSYSFQRVATMSDRIRTETTLMTRHDILSFWAEWPCIVGERLSERNKPVDSLEREQSLFPPIPAV